MKKYLGIAILSVLFACNGSGKKAAAVTGAALTPGTVNEVQLADPRIDSIFKGYLGLKNSLVASNAVAAQQTAKDLSTALKSFAGCENTALIADKISGTGDIVIQRKEFTDLSSDVIALFKHVDLKKGNIYVQHCPMANNGDGGDWLSSQRIIRNPYYGDKMLGCGGVVEVISPKK